MLVKEFINKFVESFRDNTRDTDGWRPASRHLGIDHQRLMYRAKNANKLSGFLSLLEPMRQRLKLSKSAAWDLLVGKKNLD